jgi:hypothetical protein
VKRERARLGWTQVRTIELLADAFEVDFADLFRR